MARRIGKIGQGTQQIDVSKVVLDESVYPRSAYSWQTSYGYSQAMLSGAKFPPIVLALSNNKLILVDGKHRLEAYKMLKKSTIEAEIYSGWDKKRIFVEAIKRNVSHGRSLSPFEKRQCILKLREFNISEKEVSQLVSVPQEKIEHFVGQRLISSTTGDDIDYEIVKSSLKHLAGREYAPEETGVIQSVQTQLNGESQVTIFDNLIDMLENGLVNFDSPIILKRIKKLSEILANIDVKALAKA